jgi:hypothetical protein
MQPLHRRPYSDDPNCEIQIGPSTWDAGTMASKFAWRTSAGAWARGGEQPLWAVVDEVALATEVGALTWDDIFGAIFEGCSVEQTMARTTAILGALNRKLSGRRAPGSTPTPTS